MDLPSEAKAGFPIQALELPPPPMGNDWIPVEMRKAVIINEGIWVMVGLILASIVIKSWPKKTEETEAIAWTMGVVGILLHLVLFVFWFD